MGNGRIRMSVVAGALAAIVAGSVLSAPAGAAPEKEVGLVRVVHGLRGLVADIYLDGTLVLPTFQPERSTDPLPIPAGDHVVDIRKAGAGADETPLLTQTVTVPAGFQGSLVAHLNPNGKASLTAYADNVSEVPAGQTRVVVRHAAAAEPVSVLLNDWPTFGRVKANQQVGQVVGAGEYQVAVTALKGGAPLATPQGVEYPEGTANFMYLIGSQKDGTLGWATVQVGDLQTAPAVIQTGDGSTVGAPSNQHLPLLGLLAGSAVLGGGVTVWSRTRRAVRHR